ncbi:hypothetical protein BDV96DRAFT_646853 [Lophiotrema nucula]|uniref:Uncharacterized protein n=1 Tax=Lophiotrema nucula TaxID=690887 RepID=A0A6A5Z8C0_9PLEO|nr:hypothetical protein BDV96DRAFT_646853 [Lophiotrema nucula]
MSEPADEYVKRGYWVNWNDGAIMGRTITVESRTGNLIIALLTILASVASAQLWNLVTFFYHQHRARGAPADGLFWQQQALLRTLPTPTSLMADSAKLWWAWRKRADRPILRSAIPMSVAMLFAIAALAAGIFSNYLVNSSNIEIMVDSPLCRYINLTTFWSSLSNPEWSKLNQAVEAYTRNCYANESSVPSACTNTFTRPVLPIAQSRTACPWNNSSMCHPGELPATTVDTGLMNVNEWLGINLAPKDTVRFRKRTTCNPVPIDGRADVRPMSDFAELTVYPSKPGEEALALRFGTLPAPEDEFPEYTFISSLTKANWTDTFTGRGRISYTTDDPVLSSNSFKPIPGMERTDADVIVDLISMNSVWFNEPVNDTLYSAHRQYSYTYNGRNITIYSPDQFAGVIGCAEQYQFCLKHNDTCTGLTALPTQFEQKDFPTASDVQLAVLRTLRILSVFNDLSNGGILQLFQANDLISAAVLRTLPDDQWVDDVTFWESYALAGIQTMLSDVAVGPIRRDANADSYTDPPQTAGEHELCKSMKMRKAGGFANVNVFGLSFIVTFSVIVTVLNLTILRFILFLSKFRHALGPRLERWAQDGLFQLQRRAFDAHAEGTWIRLEDEIPVTETDSRMAELPVESMPVFAGEKSLMRGKTWRTDVTAVTESGSWKEKEDLEKVPTYESAKTESSDRVDEIRSVDPEDERSYLPKKVLDDRATRNRDR